MYARHLSRRASLFRWSCIKRDPQGSSLKPSAASCRNRSPIRCFATRSAADGYLLELVNSEIEKNRRKVQPQNVHVKDSPLGPFTLTDKLGTEEVVLSRTLGREKINILCALEKQYPEDEDEVEEQELQHRRLHHNNEQKFVVHEEDLQIVSVLHMSVTLTRADSRLEVVCSFAQGASDVMIEDVLFHEPDSSLVSSTSTDEPEPYGGPIFEDLDEKLQEAFLQLLKARGINVKVARYMIDYMAGKGEREYIGWLHRLNRFFTC